jgi:hypothetical protein
MCRRGVVGIRAVPLAHRRLQLRLLGSRSVA